ncbi:hypothetical protein NDU88_005004, partial [Pleurodeles waltl]
RAHNRVLEQRSNGEAMTKAPEPRAVCQCAPIPTTEHKGNLPNNVNTSSPDENRVHKAHDQTTLSKVTRTTPVNNGCVSHVPYDEQHLEKTIPNSNGMRRVAKRRARAAPKPKACV